MPRAFIMSICFGTRSESFFIYIIIVQKNSPPVKSGEQEFI